MRKSIQQKLDKALQEGTTHQEMAAFFWASDKSSDEDKYWLNNHLASFEDMINQKDEYNEAEAEMAIIHMQLRIDAVQMYARSHSALKHEYDLSTQKNEGYRVWLQHYILSDPATELHIIQDRKASKKFLELQKTEGRTRS